MGRRPTSRRGDLDGVLVIDKPVGMTSHDVVQVVRRVTGQRKAGHTGTLDPDATGVLIVCLGRATRLVQYLQSGPKTYVADAVLGLATSTQDAAGDPILEADASAIDEAAVVAALDAFRGDIMQMPPMVSAIKIDGERLHEKARRGEEVDRPARPVTVHELTLDAFTPGERATLTLTAVCSPGTYVRTLAHDLGAALGVGGSLTGLRRTVNGGFGTDVAVPLGELEALHEAEDEAAVDALIIDLRTTADRLQPVEVDATSAREVAFGRPIARQGIAGPYAVVHGATFLAVYADDGGKARPQVVLVTPQDLPNP